MSADTIIPGIYQPEDFLYSDYKQSEIGMIPSDWSVFSIGDLFDYMHTASNARSDLDHTGTVSYVHYGDIHVRFNHFIDFNHDEIPRLSDNKSTTATRLCDGDLIVADASEDETGVGKSVEVRNLGAIEAISGLHTFLLRAKDERIHHGYRGYVLEKPSVKIQLRRLATGLKVFGISKQSLSDVRIPLPLPAEQRAIAETLSDVDGLLGALDALIAKKRTIKQAAMQQLLTGKTRLPGFSGEWETKRLGGFANIDPENLPANTKPDYEFNYISLEQVETGRLRGFTAEIFRTSPSRARRRLRRNDVLMSTVRPNLMGHYLFGGTITNAVCSTGFAVLRYKRNLSVPGFLFAHLFGPVVNRQIERLLAGSNYPAISSHDAALIEILCPPTVEEQAAIAAVLSDMDTEIAALERRRDKTRAFKQGMMQQLLTGRTRLLTPE